MLNFPKSVYAIFLLLVVIFACFTYAHEIIKVAFFGHFGDFGNYYFYSRALRLNYNIYALNQDTIARLKDKFGMPQFVLYAGHSPAFFFLMRWITFFDYRSASILWLILNNILLFSSLAIILLLALNKRPNPDKNFIIASSVFLVLSFQPLIENIVLGQINLFILFLFSLCLYFLSQKRHALSGIVLGLGILIKPHLGIILLFFLWKRCYRVFFSAALTLLFTEILSLSLKIIGNLKFWTLAVNRFAVQNFISTSMDNLSLGSLINRIIDLDKHPELVFFALGMTFILSLILFIATLYVTKDKFKKFDDRFVLEFSLFLLLLFIVFPLVHEHHYVLLYLPIIFIWVRLNSDLKFQPASLFIISYLLLGLKYSLIRFPVFGAGWLSLLSGLKLYGVIILFLLAASLVSKLKIQVKE